MTYEIVIPVIVSFAISALLGPIVIPFLRRLKVGQTERKELESHLKKNGTPTMGGLMILASIIITSVFYVKDYPKIIPILFMTVGFGVIGFLDDYLKVVLRRSDGLLAWQKMLCQIVVTTVFAVYMVMLLGCPAHHADSVLRRKIFRPRLGSVPGTVFCAVIGTVNGSELYRWSGRPCVERHHHGGNVLLRGGDRNRMQALQPITCAVVGALLGFLLFNVYPASVFMGDTGSLALGGFVVSAAYMMQMPLFIVIVGLIYLVEVLSVIIQVTYFKKTGGKRIFRMAPIHHHFELGGWSETRVVAVFSIITAILCHGRPVRIIERKTTWI